MKGTLWLAWRQQRALVLGGGLLLALCAAWVVFQRPDAVAFVDEHHLAGCKGWDGGDEEGCDGEAFARLFDGGAGGLGALAALSVALPVLIGVFWGAPLLGREFENGTIKLALTQGVSVRRWFATRFALATVCAVTGSAVLAALVAWWWQPTANMLSGFYWHDGYIFNATGPAAVACAFFGLAAGTAAGLLMRRTLAAMGVTLAAVGGTRLLLNTFRSDWIAPTTRVTPGMTPKQPVGSAWSTGDFGYLDAAGREYPISRYCQTSGEDLRRCMAENGFVARYHKVHPVGDFWAFQWIETALFLGAAAALVAVTCLVLRRRLV
ncbi:hypothetical protein BLA24_15535 [Streptomyces cinnamoneus]|uniref:Uncharacterized protein n=1 Tax=Streptomyces cinnamoneus TaxID=53446 RepID=A0A2G1XJ56_STRCJ|nr:transporter [Streptomyces cinnamoneus]PHQ51169.1 hypothetical protein BLA24_15535 [Streptomyces cinnamoneus]PPT13607.1 transporter [Streptomyces cinnamoneus]